MNHNQSDTDMYVSEKHAQKNSFKDEVIVNHNQLNTDMYVSEKHTQKKVILRINTIRKKIQLLKADILKMTQVF